MRQGMMYKIVGAFVIVLAVVVFLTMQGSTVGIDSDITNDFILILPSISIIIVGAVAVANSSGIYVLGAFALIGVGFAYMTSTLNSLSILVPDLLTATFTLGDLQLIILVFSTLMGAVFMSVRD